MTMLVSGISYLGGLPWLSRRCWLLCPSETRSSIFVLGSSYTHMGMDWPLPCRLWVGGDFRYRFLGAPSLNESFTMCSHSVHFRPWWIPAFMEFWYEDVLARNYGSSKKIRRKRHVCGVPFIQASDRIGGRGWFSQGFRLTGMRFVAPLAQRSTNVPIYLLNRNLPARSMWRQVAVPLPKFLV